jgi:hypothetical protein
MHEEKPMILSHIGFQNLVFHGWWEILFWSYIYMITCSEAKQLEKSYSPNLMLYSN